MGLPSELERMVAHEDQEMGVEIRWNWSWKEELEIRRFFIEKEIEVAAQHRCPRGERATLVYRTYLLFYSPRDLVEYFIKHMWWFRYSTILLMFIIILFLFYYIFLLFIADLFFPKFIKHMWWYCYSTHFINIYYYFISFLVCFMFFLPY